MKILSVKKIKRLHFKISYSFGENKYINRIFAAKAAFVCFLGLPLYATKYIFIPENNLEF